jgi:hypothetical protein
MEEPLVAFALPQLLTLPSRCKYIAYFYVIYMVLDCSVQYFECEVIVRTK